MARLKKPSPHLLTNPIASAASASADDTRVLLSPRGSSEPAEVERELAPRSVDHTRMKGRRPTCPDAASSPLLETVRHEISSVCPARGKRVRVRVRVHVSGSGFGLEKKVKVRVRVRVRVRPSKKYCWFACTSCTTPSAALAKHTFCPDVSSACIVLP